MKKFMNRSAKGFTLIELLVVIAIIAILSTIVLGSLGQARGRARDTRAQSEMSSMRAQAEIYYNQNNLQYAGAGCNSGMFSDMTSNGLGKLVLSVANYVNSTPSLTATPANGTNIACASTVSTWSVSAILPNSKKPFCVDSTGVAKEYPSTITTAAGATTGGLCTP